ncbi:MAG: ketopantoate reductase family protein [Candidatus Hodarchaeales archaeon]|jgi:2-dehydropantoate 2-reductase
MLRVVVIGAGAVGGPVAIHMVEHGVDVTLVTKYQELAEKIRNDGLIIEGVERARKVMINAIPRIEDLDDKFDIVFLAMKATDVEKATKSVLHFIKDDSVIVTLQNGIVEDMVAKIVGASRVIGAVVGWGSTMLEPGLIEKTSHGDFIIGLLDNTGHNGRLEQVEELLSYSEDVRITDNIYGALYSKLTINACITGLGAICGLYLGEMLSKRRVRRISMGIITEAVAVAKGLGYDFEKISGLRIPALALSESESKLDILKKHALIRIIGFKYRRLKSSSLQSLERGKKSEIDFLNGYIVRKGKELGIDTPINDACVTIVKEIEQGKRKIVPDNLLEIPEP